MHMGEYPRRKASDPTQVEWIDRGGNLIAEEYEALPNGWVRDRIRLQDRQRAIEAAGATTPTIEAFLRVHPHGSAAQLHTWMQHFDLPEYRQWSLEAQRQAALGAQDEAGNKAHAPRDPARAGAPTHIPDPLSQHHRRPATNPVTQRPTHVPSAAPLPVAPLAADDQTDDDDDTPVSLLDEAKIGGLRVPDGLPLAGLKRLGIVGPGLSSEQFYGRLALARQSALHASKRHLEAFQRNWLDTQASADVLRVPDFPPPDEPAVLRAPPDPRVATSYPTRRAWTPPPVPTPQGSDPDRLGYPAASVRPPATWGEIANQIREMDASVDRLKARWLAERAQRLGR
jgi:hypothetical protein